MKCQNLFSGKDKKNISKCRLLKILPRVLCINDTDQLYLLSVSSAVITSCNILHISPRKLIFKVNGYTLRFSHHCSQGQQLL